MPLPGPGVSHSSFRYKHVGIVIYHDLCNLLIMASFHPEFAPRPGILTILGWTMFHVLVHRYRAGLSCLIAIEDYLVRPDVTFAVDGGQRLGIVRERVNALPVPDVWTDVGTDSLPLLLPPVRDQHRALGGCVRSDPSAHHLKLDTGNPGFLFKSQPEPMAVSGRRYLLVLDRDGVRSFDIRPKRMTLIRLTARAFIMALLYGLHGKRAAARWHAAKPVLCSRERWALILGQTHD